MPELDGLTLALLFVAALSAGWLDAVGGGGGLIQLPALLIALPPQLTVSALGTNKVSSIIGTIAAAATYANKVPPPKTIVRPMMVAAFLGSGIGSLVASRLNPEVFRPIIFVLLIGMWIFMIINPAAKVRGLEDHEVPMHSMAYPIFIGIGLGFYDGAIGPGFGAFLLLTLVNVFGLSFLRSSATAKFVNVATNFASILIFATSGHIIWLLGAAMGCFNLLGGVMGSRMAIRYGSGFVRGVLLTAVALLIVRLGWSIWG
jgi:uncharacterized membrane protein YfcA